jgi:hypothetical protein
MAGSRGCPLGRPELHADPASSLPGLGAVLPSGLHAGVRPLAVLVSPLLLRFIKSGRQHPPVVEGRPLGGLLCGGLRVIGRVPFMSQQCKRIPVRP